MLAIAAIALVAVWLYAVAGSTGRLRALSLPAEAVAGPVSVSQPPHVVNGREQTHDAGVAPVTDNVLNAQETIAPPVAAESVATEDSFGPQSAGPISGAAFSELLESGLLGDELGAENDPTAAEALRSAVLDAENRSEPE